MENNQEFKFEYKLSSLERNMLIAVLRKKTFELTLVNEAEEMLKLRKALKNNQKITIVIQ